MDDSSVRYFSAEEAGEPTTVESPGSPAGFEPVRDQPMERGTSAVERLPYVKLGDDQGGENMTQSPRKSSKGGRALGFLAKQD